MVGIHPFFAFISSRIYNGSICLVMVGIYPFLLEFIMVLFGKYPSSHEMAPLVVTLISQNINEVIQTICKVPPGDKIHNLMSKKQLRSNLVSEGYYMNTLINISFMPFRFISFLKIT